MPNKHKPGPWHCGNRDNWWRIYDENGFYIAAARDPSPAPNHKADGFDIEEANARLIAAAPDLLAALEAARDVLELANRYFPKSVQNRDTFSLLNTLANAVKPAIAKATGETP